MNTAPPKTIFVSIASYRDPECRWTIRDLFSKALLPNRVRVGLVNQYIPGVDDDIALFDDFRDRTTPVYFDARQSLGACWAKATAQSLWGGEDFILNVDSHMRFAPGWDQSLLDLQSAAAQPYRTVISTYPPPYTPPNTRSWETHIIVPDQFEPGGALRFAARAQPLEHPVRSAYLSGNFYFAPAEFLRYCPYDPSLYQSGEEISMSVRAWSWGWDICCPADPVAYHYYVREAAPRHHDDSCDWASMHTQAENKVRLMLESDAAYRDSYVTGRQFGLGCDRSVEAFEYATGINFRERTLEDWSKRGQFRGLN